MHCTSTACTLLRLIRVAPAKQLAQVTYHLSKPAKYAAPACQSDYCMPQSTSFAVPWGYSPAQLAGGAAPPHNSSEHEADKLWRRAASF